MIFVEALIEQPRLAETEISDRPDKSLIKPALAHVRLCNREYGRHIIAPRSGY